MHIYTHTQIVMSLNCIPHEHCKASINFQVCFTTLSKPNTIIFGKYMCEHCNVLSPSITKNKRTMRGAENK